MFPIVSKEFGNVCFSATMSWTIVMEVGEVTFVDFALRAGLALVVGAQELCVLRAGMGCGMVVGAFYVGYHL